MLKHFISARLNCHNGRLRIFIIFYLFEEGVAHESTRKAMRRSEEADKGREEKRAKTAGCCINFN